MFQLSPATTWSIFSPATIYPPAQKSSLVGIRLYYYQDSSSSSQRVTFTRHIFRQECRYPLLEILPWSYYRPFLPPRSMPRMTTFPRLPPNTRMWTLLPRYYDPPPHRPIHSFRLTLEAACQHLRDTTFDLHVSGWSRSEISTLSHVLRAFPTFFQQRRLILVPVILFRSRFHYAGQHPRHVLVVPHQSHHHLAADLVQHRLTPAPW